VARASQGGVRFLSQRNFEHGVAFVDVIFDPRLFYQRMLA